MKKLMKSKLFLIGLLSVITLGAFLTFAYAINENSSADLADQGLNKGEKSELALLKCGDEGDEGDDKKCGEAEGEKKCGEGEKKDCEGKEKKCGDGDEKKCGDGDDADDDVEEETEETTE